MGALAVEVAFQIAHCPINCPCSHTVAPGILKGDQDLQLGVRAAGSGKLLGPGAFPAEPYLFSKDMCANNPDSRSKPTADLQ